MVELDGSDPGGTLTERTDTRRNENPQDRTTCGNIVTQNLDAKIVKFQVQMFNVAVDVPLGCSAACSPAGGFTTQPQSRSSSTTL